ncbi:MAG: tape measure protein [Dyella sp.]|uniref:tape measure protein n=1 Tax=Dyella sp. TaxID=1869338 RepID=UPI003F7D308B
MTTNYTVGVRFTGNSSSLDAAAAKAAESEAKVGRAGQEAGAQAVRGLKPVSDQLNNLASTAVKVLGGLGVVEVAKRLGGIADEYANIGAQMRQASGDAVTFSQAQDTAYGVAQRTNAQLSSTADLISKVNRSLVGMGETGVAAFQKAASLAESINQAVALSHVSAASADAALTQLSQGLASGTLRGDELNSVLEQTPRLAQAIADGMGITIGQLRAYGQQGLITSQTVITALQSQSETLRKEYGDLPLTIGRAWTGLTNAVERFIGQADQATASSRLVAQGIALIGNNIETLSSVAIALGIGKLAQLAASFVASRAAAVQAALAQGALAEAELSEAVAAEAAAAAQLSKATAMKAAGLSVAAMTELETAYAAAQARTAAATEAVSVASIVSQSGLKGLAGVLRSVFSLTNVLAVGIAGITYAIYKNIQAEEERERKFDEGIAQLHQGADAARDMAGALNDVAAVPFKPLPDFGTVLKQWSDNTAEVSKRSLELATKQRELVQVTHDLDEANKAANSGWGGTGVALGNLTLRSQELKREIALLQPALRDLDAQTNALGVSMNNTLAPGLRDAANAAHELFAGTAADSLIDGFAARLQQWGIQAGVLKDNAKEWNAANGALASSIEGVNEKYKTFGKSQADILREQLKAVQSTVVWTQASKEQRQALLDSANAAIAHAQAMEKSKAPTDRHTAAQRAAAAAARELAQATSEADRAQASLDERITEAHEKLSGLSDQQLEYNRGVREAVADYQSWIRAGVPVDQAMQRLSTRYQQLAELRDTNTQLAQQEINQTPQRVQAYRVETSEAERYYQVISEGAKSAADTIANYFVRNVRSIKDLWKGLADSAKTIVAQILSTWLQLRVLQPLLGSIFSAGSGGSLWGQIGSYFVQNAVSGGGSATAGGTVDGGGSSTGGGSTGHSSLSDYYTNLKTAKSVYGYMFGAGGASSFSGGGSLVAGSTYLGPGSTALGAYGGGQSAGVLAGGTYTGPGSTAIGWSSGAPYANYTPYGGTWGVGGYSAPVASYGGALAGAYYGAHQGSGGLSTVASTVSYGALGAGIAGTAAGVAGGASVGAAAGSAFGATAAASSWIPVVGWVLAAMAVVDAVSGGKLFGTKYRPTQGETVLSLGADGGSATQQITEKRQGALFSGAKWRTKEVQASADAQKAADQLYNSISKSMVQGAQQLGVTVPAMINAQLQIQTDYNSKGQVKSTEYLVNYLGRTWKEATADAAAQRLGAEAIIATVAASAGQEAQRVAEQWRDSAQALADGAQFLLAAQTDINKGNSLLAIGASATLTQVTAFVQQMQADGETLAQTYQRLAQASAQYLQFVGQFQPQTQTFGGALEAINQQMLANINQANALAQAAGLQGAREQDLANIHQYAAQQAAAAIAQLDSAAQDLVSKLYGVTQGSLAAITSQLDAMKAKVQASTQTAIGDLSPLNDKQKLDLALKGLRSGITSADDVLSLGRKLYASSSDYTGLYNQVMSIVGGSGAADAGASLDQYNQLAAQQATLQAQAQATQRFNDAKQLAQYVADLSQVHGVSYGEAANGLGLNLQSLAKDLGLTNLTGYLDTLKQQDIPGTTMTAASSIVDAIRGIGSDIVSAILKAPIVQPGPTTATGGAGSDAQQQALLDKLNKLIEQNNQIIKHTGTTADTNRELLGNSKRDILRGTLYSSRASTAP